MKHDTPPTAKLGSSISKCDKNRKVSDTEMYTGSVFYFYTIYYQVFHDKNGFITIQTIYRIGN